MSHPSTAAAEDSVKADPKHYTVELENDKVRVVRISYGPREKSVMHSHPAGAAVFLNDQEWTFTFPDGTTQQVRAKAGQTGWYDAFTHLPENPTDRPQSLIYIELK